VKRDELPEAMAAVQSMSLVIPFFPQEQSAQLMIANEFMRFVGTKGQLEWFTPVAISKVAKYEGLPAFRALFCTRFEPADGEQASVIFTGYSEGELEQKYFMRQAEADQKRLESYKAEHQRLLESGEPIEALVLAAPRLLSTPHTESRLQSELKAPEWLRHHEGLPALLDRSWAESPDWLRKDQGMPTRAELRKAEAEIETVPRRWRTPEENAEIWKIPAIQELKAKLESTAA